MLSVCGRICAGGGPPGGRPTRALSRQKRDNAHTIKIAVLFKLRAEFKSMTAAWKTALSTVADEIAQVRGADRMLMLVYR